MRLPALAVAAALLAGCGVPGDPVKQAEEVQSVAAEGALLAHDAAEGDTLATFTRAHGRALRKRIDELRPAAANEEIARLVGEVSTDLERLVAGEDPARIERSLERAADAAERLAG